MSITFPAPGRVVPVAHSTAGRLLGAAPAPTEKVAGKGEDRDQDKQRHRYHQLGSHHLLNAILPWTSERRFQLQLSNPHFLAFKETLIQLLAALETIQEQLI